MIRSINSYLLLTFVMLMSFGCRQAKYVEEGNYLLKSNEISFVKEKNGKIKYKSSHPKIDDSEMYGLIRPEPNRSVKLFFYNRIDSTKLKEQVEHKKEKYRKKNAKRKAKQDRINLERIEEAEAEGDSLYRHKVIAPKTVRLGWRKWVRENLGQGPILLDTFKVRKSSEQMRIYLSKKGFYSASVTDTVIYNDKRRKAEVQFIVDPGKPYTIRNYSLDSSSMNAAMLKGYREMIELQEDIVRPGNLLDQDVLDAERERFAKYCRNEQAMLGFNQNYIGFLVDTTVGDLQADVVLYVKPKTIKDESDSTGKTLIEFDHLVYMIREVTFYLHNPDTASFKDYEAYKEKCAKLGLTIDKTKGEFPLLDTLEFYGEGIFIYNEIPFVDPHLLDRQNFLELPKDSADNRYYKEYYVDRSYRAMSDLGIFSNITPKIEIDPAEPLGRWVLVTYDLTPAERQSFLFEPRLSNTNSILGIQGAMSYTNKNLHRGAQQLKISFTGGMESQPLIVGADANGDRKKAWELNTFEWGPKISLTVPKLAPLPNSWTKGLSKRAYPQSVFDLNVNFQKRTEFKRTLTQFGYLWSIKIPKTQSLSLKLVEFNFVKLNKEDFFQEKLENLNDPFLLNSYTDHLSTITKLTWTYSNLNSNFRTKKNFHNISATASVAGFGLTPLIYNGLSTTNFSGVSVNGNGLKQLFGVPYTQFLKLDIQYIGSIYINRKHKFVYRAMAGAGKAIGNSPSLPYEQAFFAGGANDIRAFKARTMAPGSYKTYADTNATTTQIGDSRFEVNAEWRFEMTQILEGAVFVDAGNIWNLARTGVPADDPTVLKASSYKEIALGIGYGIRADFDFLIIRLDLSFALHNPHLPAGERWFLSDKTGYKSYFQTDPETGKLIDYELPHPLRLNFGIGYPF